MTTQIVVHLMPYELDWFDWQSKQIKIGSNFLEKSDKIILDVTLNLNLVVWEESKIPKDFFIEKFNNILLLWDWCEKIVKIDDKNIFVGCNDNRRDCARNTNADNILYLDSDLIFKPETLKYIISGASFVDSEYYIISPEIIKLWDNTWDVITNKNYINRNPSLSDYNSIDPFHLMSKHTEDAVQLKKINEFKFGGGWFNLLSSKLLKLIDIPDSFGPYGPDDYFVIICCQLMKNKRYDISQYVLENIVVTENNKYRNNIYKNYLTIVNKQKEFRTNAEKHFDDEILKFNNRI